MNIQPTTSIYSCPNFSGRNLHGVKIKPALNKLFIPEAAQERVRSHKTDSKFKSSSVVFMRKFLDFCESKYEDIWGITENPDKIYNQANKNFELVA